MLCMRAGSVGVIWPFKIKKDNNNNTKVFDTELTEKKHL